MELFLISQAFFFLSYRSEIINRNIIANNVIEILVTNVFIVPCLCDKSW